MEKKIEIEETPKVKILIRRVGNIGIGRILMIIGVIISILSILLSYAFPKFVGWYWYTEDNSAGYPNNYYLTGLGTYICEGALKCPNGLSIIVLFGGILVLLGSIICFVAGVKKMKLLAVLGGIIIFLGPFLLIFEIFTGIDYFNELLSDFDNLIYDSIVNKFHGRNINMTGFETRISWGIGNGFFVAIIGGALGSIGALLILIQGWINQIYKP